MKYKYIFDDLPLIDPVTDEDLRLQYPYDRQGKHSYIIKDEYDTEKPCFNCKSPTMYYDLVAEYLPVCSEECDASFWVGYNQNINYIDINEIKWRV